MANESEIQSVDAAATGTLEAEINELLDFPSIGEVEEPSNTGNESDEAPIEDGVTDEGVGEEVVKESVDVTPVVEAPSDELSLLKAQIEALKGVVTQLSTPKESAKRAPELAPDLDTLMAGVDFDEIMESREKFMGFIKDAFQIMTQSTTGYVQSVVPDVVTRQVTMQEVRENFYKENQDLNAVRPYVAMVASNVAQANPEMGVAEVLTKAAEVARELLGISKIAPQVLPANVKSPALPGARGVRQQATSKSDLQKQIDELLED